MAKHLTTYTLYAQGPDNMSTYAECFGPNGGKGRYICSGDASIIDTALLELGHSNCAILRHARQGVRAAWLTRNEFRAEAF